MREDFKAIRRLRYPLPDVVEPAESICIQVQIPNDLAYIAAFWGQMFALTRWYAWMGDTAHTGKDVAARWLQVYEAAKESECQNVLIRTSPVNDCLLQVSYDGGGLWETVYSAYSCALKAANDEFGSHSDQPGGRSQPGEQPGGATPTPGQCFDLDLTVNGNSMTLIPLPIRDRWSLTLSEIKGAWNDGNIGHDWVCPNGHAFFLGTCSPLVEGTNPTDPIPTEPHMKLILRLPNGNYVAIPQDGSTYIVPNGMPEGNTFLLANDDGLADNQGSVSLHLLACSGLYDFSLCYPAGGSGPVGALFGQNFTVNSGLNPNGHQVITMGIDINCTLTLVSTTGYVIPTSGGDTVYAHNTGQPSCDINHIFGNGIINGGSPLFTSLVTSGVYIGSNGGVWSATFRIDP